MGRRPDPLADRRVTPLWLSHHWPEDYDRCVLIGRRHVCRRCLVLYPLAFGVALVVAAIVPDVATAPWTAWVTVLAPLPAVVEFVAEHLGAARHSPARQVAVTVPLGVGLGVGFARYLSDLTDPVFWGTVVVYGGVCGLAAIARVRRMPDADAVLYFNPNCSKARGARDLLADAGAAVSVVDYRKHPLDRDELVVLLGELDDDPAALVRKDGRFRDLGLDAADYTTPDAVATLLAEHPELMERPVFRTGGRAVIGRPPERVLDLL